MELDLLLTESINDSAMRELTEIDESNYFEGNKAVQGENLASFPNYLTFKIDEN